MKIYIRSTCTEGEWMMVSIQENSLGYYIIVLAFRISAGQEV